MKKRSLVLIAAIVTLTILSACSGSNGGGAAAGKSEVTVLFGKEVTAQFEKMIEQYNETQDAVQVKLIPLAGQNAYEKMTTLYNSGNAPTIMSMGQEFTSFQDKLLDLTSEDWVSHSSPGSLDYVTVDGKVYGMPLTVESFGLIYNKTVMDEAFGGSFDPTTITTRDALKEAFDKVAALDSTDGAIHISPMDWSLGAHLTNIFFTAQAETTEERHEFMADLKAGTVGLADNAVFNGWLDTVDLLFEYNSEKAAPLAPLYDDGPLKLADGKVGMWFMGNWAYPQLAEIDPDAEFGFLPVPVSNDPAAYGNTQLSVGVPSYWTIDASQSSPEEQQGAKDFLNWMITSPEGQEGYVNSLNFIPVFDNFTAQPEDPLSASIMDYMSRGKTLEWMNTYYPAEAFPAMGASLQKYLGGQIDRTKLTQEIADYWKTAK